MTSSTANLTRVDAAAEDAPGNDRGRSLAGRAHGFDHAQFVRRADAIVVAAYDLLNEYGLEGLTVRAVLNRTGLNRRAFYERFSGKDDLVLAVFEQSLQALAGQCREKAKALPDPLARLKFMVTNVIMGSAAENDDPMPNMRRSAALCREHMRLAEARPDDLRAALQPLITVFAEQLADGMACGQVRQGSPLRMANLIYNLVSTSVHAEVLALEAGEPERSRLVRLAEDIWAFCRGGVAA